MLRLLLSALDGASLAEMQGIVFIGSGKISFGKLSQALDYGALTLQIKGDFDACLRRIRQIAVDRPEVGIYLMKVYTDISVPRELIDAARIDGGGEARIFFRVALPLMVPGLMTVLLISVVAVWNNYFLPLLIFNVNTKYPLTVGLGLWSERAQNSGNAQLFPMVVIGGLVTIIPLIALFLLLQRYWRGGLLLGSIAN